MEAVVSQEYQMLQLERIRNVREKYPLQPIVFAGAGLSIRWVGAPNWENLLSWAIEHCPLIDQPIQFFKQNSPDLPSVAGELVESYRKWAWTEGKSKYPDILFNSDVPKDIYLKFSVAQHIKSLGVVPNDAFQSEAASFASIRPHAVITTNYDAILEQILPDYQPVLGRGIISAPFASIGEIFKIHGSVEKPSSLVLTREDYEIFDQKRKYLSAKLLTFFAEHPVIFVGYGASDPNILKILSDLDEALELDGGLMENIFFLNRGSENPGFEQVLKVSSSKGIRVNAIGASDFSWVFDAFSHSAPISNVNPQVLRSILARSYRLVRSDIPRNRIEVDFDFISERVDSPEEFAKLFGLATLETATEFSTQFKYNLTEIGKKLGFPGWHGANKLISVLHKESGVDLKSTDNRYHCTVRISKKSKAHMYSEEMFHLLESVRDGLPYAIRQEGGAD